MALALVRVAAWLVVAYPAQAFRFRNSTAHTSRAHSSLNSSVSTSVAQQPCQCVANDAAWPLPTRTVPKCIFVDLGAADGNSFKQFLANAYGSLANCPSGGQWEALLVEANPQFTPALNAEAAAYPGLVHVHGSTAAYMCQGQTSFSIDPDVAHNHWGSSMKRQHGATTVTVPTLNVNQLIAQSVIYGDYVILKVDIEGAEYDVLPCFSQYQQANKVDIIYLEEHAYLQANSAYSNAEYLNAKTSLKAAGVQMPAYNSPTL